MKKICKMLLIATIMGTIGIQTILANPYQQTGPYGTNCTWYAWQMAYEKAGVVLPGWGNAKNWYQDALNSGYSVGTTPRANSIVVWGGWTAYGHVGYVESVAGNVIRVWDSTGPCIDETSPEYVACIQNGVSEETDRQCRQNAKKVACEYTLSPDRYGITGYIYLDVAPKPKVQIQQTPLPTPTPTPEVVKSNNTNLSEIKISSGEITFQPNITEYEISVKNKIDKINIEATVEDTKSTVEGIGEYDLKVGDNEVKLTVTAEDGTVKEYVLNITREKKEKKVKKMAEPVKKESHNKVIIIGISMITIIVICIGMIYLKKKNRKDKK